MHGMAGLIGTDQPPNAKPSNDISGAFHNTIHVVARF